MAFPCGALEQGIVIWDGILKARHENKVLFLGKYFVARNFHSSKHPLPDHQKTSYIQLLTPVLLLKGTDSAFPGGIISEYHTLMKCETVSGHSGKQTLLLRIHMVCLQPGEAGWAECPACACGRVGVPGRAQGAAAAHGADGAARRGEQEGPGLGWGCPGLCHAHPAVAQSRWTGHPRVGAGSQ